MPRGTLPPLMLISDAGRVGLESFLHTLRAAWGAGLRLLQVREHEPEWVPGRERFVDGLLDAALALPRPADALVIVNRDVDLCVRRALDGVHVGGGDPGQVARARDALGPDAWVGYSAHGLDEIRRAAEAGADYVTYSPIYGSISKRHPLPAVGIEGLARAVASAPVPVYALGGITCETVGDVARAGAAGVAVIGAVVDAPRPESAVREILTAWSEATGAGSVSRR